MADDKEVIDVMSQDQTGKDLWANTLKEYPILADKNIAYTYQPMPGAGYLETYDTQETGDPNNPALQRPPQIPLGQYGIQVRSPDTTPQMIMGDALSHILNQVHPDTQQPIDPGYYKLYQQFAQTMQTPEWQKTLAEDYAKEQEMAKAAGEKMDFGDLEHYVNANRIPAYMRGYTINQWSPEENKWASPEQQQIMNQIREYYKLK